MCPLLSSGCQRPAVLMTHGGHTAKHPGGTQDTRTQRHNYETHDTHGGHNMMMMMNGMRAIMTITITMMIECGKLFRPLPVQMMMRWCFQTPWKLQITSPDFFLFLPECSRHQTCITYASQPTSQSSLDYLALIRRKEVDIYSWSPDTQRTTLIFLTNGR